MDYFSAAILGIVEGLTEFLPISSTGHLILVASLLKVDPEFSKLFNVVIQLGAILAIVVLYWKTFLRVLIGLPRERSAQHFTRNVLLAFLPAMVIGFFAHDAIKEYLFSSQVVAAAMIVGGLLILLIEKKKPLPTVFSTETMGWRTALKIGFIQCLAMIPGVSRSGASIMGGMMVGVERKAAAEFSFFLAVPTMLAATVYDLYRARDTLGADGMDLIAVGFVVSFVVAIIVVRWMMAFITRHGFAPFAYYRILIGILLFVLIGTGHLA
jgi:undecaprenyl-diphosphatase